MEPEAEMRYHVCRDPDATDPARRWVVIDDEYGLVIGYGATKEEAAGKIKSVAK